MRDMASRCKVSCNFMYGVIRIMPLLLCSSCSVAFLRGHPEESEYEDMNKVIIPVDEATRFDGSVSAIRFTTSVRPVAAAGGNSAGIILGSNEEPQGLPGVPTTGEPSSSSSASPRPADVARPRRMNASPNSKTTGDLPGSALRNRSITATNTTAPSLNIPDLEVKGVRVPKTIEEFVVESDRKISSAVAREDKSLRGTNRERAVGEKPKALSRVDKNKLVNAETTAAEKVLTLVELGLLNKEETVKYFDALSELERSSRELETRLGAPSRQASNELLRSVLSKTGEEEPLNLIPFPAICALLGASGVHALHLSGDADTAVTVIGAAAGAGVGSLVLLGDDPLGRAARSVSKTIAVAIGSAGGWAGKEVSTRVFGAIGGSAASAREVLVQAPKTLAVAVGSSVMGSLSAVAASVVAWPRELARRAAQGAQESLQRTSEATARVLAGRVRAASDAAGNTLESTSRATLEAVKDSVAAATGSPREAVARIRGAVQSPQSTFEAAMPLPKRAAGTQGRASGVQREPPLEKAPGPSSSSTTSQESMDRGETSEASSGDLDGGLGTAELGEKLSSVQEAFTRFDAVKVRIKNADPSDVPKVPVVATPGSDREGKERGDVFPSASKEDTTKCASSDPPQDERKRSNEQGKALRLDEERRKRVAQALLDSAAARAEDAKLVLESAAQTIRRESMSSQAGGVQEEAGDDRSRATGG